MLSNLDTVLHLQLHLHSHLHQLHLHCHWTERLKVEAGIELPTRTIRKAYGCVYASAFLNYTVHVHMLILKA